MRGIYLPLPPVLLCFLLAFAFLCLSFGFVFLVFFNLDIILFIYVTFEAVLVYER